MISLWPVRTSVLVDDGVAYFGAGVFPYEGIYICALDADDGKVIQNTACSGDELVKSPLGVLWFGEPGPEKMVERHAKAVSPVSMNGRLFVQGEEVVMAYDAYNGTLLWERKIPGAVRARADVDGGNLALTEDALYVAAHEKCYRLDPVTGETVREFEIPRTSDGSKRRWGYVSHTDNILYGSRAMPFKREYFALWKTLVDTGKWVDINEIPPEYTSFAVITLSIRSGVALFATLSGYFVNHSRQLSPQRDDATGFSLYVQNSY